MTINNFSMMAIPVDIVGKTAATLSVSATAADTADLDGGLYDMWCDVDVYVRISAASTAADGVTTGNGYLLRTGNTVTFHVPEDGRIGAIAGGAGTLSYHKVG